MKLCEEGNAVGIRFQIWFKHIYLYNYYKRINKQNIRSKRISIEEIFTTYVNLYPKRFKILVLSHQLLRHGVGGGKGKVKAYTLVFFSAAKKKKKKKEKKKEKQWSKTFS